MKGKVKGWAKALIVIVIFINAALYLLEIGRANGPQVSGYVYGIQSSGEAGIGKLPGVNVSVWNTTTWKLVNSTLTDENGYYSMNLKNPGTYSLNFTKEGFIKRGVIVSVPDLNRVSYLYSKGTGAFNVSVVDIHNNRPIPNAYVVIAHGNGSVTGTTDANGNVIMGVLAITQGVQVKHDFTVSADGYLTNTEKKGEQVNEGEMKKIEIKLKGKYRIYGYVRDKYRCEGCYGEYIPSAKIELRCGYDTSSPKINWSNKYFYNTTTSSSGFYEIYYPSTIQCSHVWVHASAQGYSLWRNDITGGGSGNVDINLTGESVLNGSVVDKNNQSYFIDNALVTVYNPDYGAVYKIYTNNGIFSVNVKRGENHTIDITKEGYVKRTETQVYNDSHSYGTLNLTGSGLISGIVADKWNNSIKIGSAKVKIKASASGPQYEVFTSQTGSFSLEVSSAYLYNVIISKGGYGDVSLSNRIGDLGTIEMEGLFEVSGSVSDCYTNLLLQNNKIDNVKVVVKSLNPSLPNVYTVYTDASGTYRVFIPQTIMSAGYNITFSHERYQTKVISYNSWHDVCLDGKLHVYGNVIDRDAIDDYRPVKNATIEILAGNEKCYQTITNESGAYSIYVGYVGDNTEYDVKINKDGYYGLTYSNVPISSSWTNTTNELVGKTAVSVSVKDKYSGKGINGSKVCIMMEEQEYGNYQNCIYSKFTDTSGSVSFNIKERSTSKKYKVHASKYGYSEVTTGPYSKGESISVSLEAATTVHVKDKYATNNYDEVSDATVIIYYNYSKTNFSYNINQTIVNITAYCNNTQRNGINVTLSCSNCKYGYNSVLTTSNGLSNATFYRVPVGNYVVTLNGSSVGCGFNTWSINITRGGMLYTGAGFTFNVHSISAKVKVVNTIGTPLENANVTLKSNASISCKTNASGICILNFVPLGNMTINASAEHYHSGEKWYIIQNVEMNDLTQNPIVLNPKNGNLSVHVINMSGGAVQGVNVTISNSTNLYFTLTDANGWANFTDKNNLFNITANGSSVGFNTTTLLNVFVTPEETTIVEVKIKNNLILIHVKNATNDDIEGANVTLWSGAYGSQIAQNALNNYLTALTNSTGHVLFERIKPGSYTLSVNKTPYALYTTTIEIPYMQAQPIEITLGDETPPKYYDVGDNESGNVAQGRPIKLFARWEDNFGLKEAVLYTNKSGSWSKWSTISISGTNNWSNFTIDTSSLSGWIFWRINASDTSSNYNVTPVQSFYVSVGVRWSALGQNTSEVNQGEPVKVYAYWNSEIELSKAVLLTNRSGSWEAETSTLSSNPLSLSGTAAWSNFTINTTKLFGYVFWKIKANNTGGEWNITDVMSFKVNDVTPPKYFNLGQNTSKVNESEPVKVYAYWIDNVNMSTVWLETNLSGSWKPLNAQSYITIYSVENWSNFTIDTTNMYGYVFWRLNGSDTSGNKNITSVMSFYVNTTTITIYVNETENGEFVKPNATGQGVVVSIVNATDGSESKTSDTGSKGYVIFTVKKGHKYNITVNGTMQGYGVNTSIKEYEIAQFGVFANNITIFVNVTKLTVNITDSDGNPVENANVTLYNSTATEFIAKNASGGFVTGLTNSNGIITFYRLLPCTKCNLTVNKTISSNAILNFTIINITAGTNLSVHMDPEPPEVGSGYGESVTLTFYLNVLNGDVSDADNITVTISGPTTMTNKTVDGVAVLYNVPPGYYNFTIDGEDVGFGKIVDNSTIGIGSIVANSGNTNTEGWISLQISGNVPYFVRVEAYGYQVYDDVLNQSGNRIGTQTIEVSLVGDVYLNGSVRDKYFASHPPLGYEPISNATLYLYMASTCDDLNENLIRYTTRTASDGSYHAYISSKQIGKNITQGYCIKTVADGYLYNITGVHSFLSNTTLNIGLEGDKKVEGVVRDIISLNKVNGTKYQASVKLKSASCYPSLSDCDAYTTSIDGEGHFSLTVSSRNMYTPYDIIIDARLGGWCIYYENNTLYPPSSNTYYLIGAEYGKIRVNVTSDLNEMLTDKVTIGIKDLNENKILLLGSEPTCTFNSTTNVMSCYIIKGYKKLIVNGSTIGYGINKTEFLMDSTQCEVNTIAFNITINATRLNITLVDENNNTIDGVNVTMRMNPVFTNLTSNGSVIFEKVPIGTYNITFSGEKTKIYFFNKTNRARLLVNLGMAGKSTHLLYVLNKTVLKIWVLNETNSTINNIDVNLVGKKLGKSYKNSTSTKGFVIIDGIVADNYTISFNSTQMYRKGYNLMTFNVTAWGGEDENTTNNYSVVISDIELIFNLTNTTGNGINFTAIVYSDGSVAKNGYGVELIKNGSGLVVFNNVIPSFYTSKEYEYIIDANKSGYGIHSGKIYVSAVENIVNKTLAPLNITVVVKNESNKAIEDNVTVYITLAGAVGTDAFGNKLNKTATPQNPNVSFTHLFVANNYVVNAYSTRYFSSSSTFNVSNTTAVPNSISFSLIERKIRVYVRDMENNTLAEGVNISIVNSTTGELINGTNGSTIMPQANVINYADFLYLPDGEFNITISSAAYFKPPSYKLSSEEIKSGKKYVYFNLKERKIKVYVRDKNNQPLKYGVDIYIVNKSDGSVVYNLIGQQLKASNVKDNITFDHIPDGEYYIIANSTTYFKGNESFNTEEVYSYAGEYSKTLTLYERKINVYVYDLSTLALSTYSVTVSITNSTGIVNNLTGVALTSTRSNGMFTFHGVPDGIFNITLNSTYYHNESIELNTVSHIPEYKVNMRRKGFGYINVTIKNTNGVVLYSAYAKLVWYNLSNITNSVEVDSGVTSNGYVVLDANITKYNNGLNVTAYTYQGSKVSSTKGYYTLSDGELKQISFELNTCGDGACNYGETPSSCPSDCYYYPSGGGGGGFGVSAAAITSVCTPKWKCEEWSECINNIQTRKCWDENNCGVNTGRPEERRACISKASLSLSTLKTKIIAGQCKYAYILVKNNGSMDIHNIHISDKIEISNCCTITPYSSIKELLVGETGNIKMKVCAFENARKGKYNYVISIFSDEINTQIDGEVDIVKGVIEVLNEEIAKLSKELKDIEGFVSGKNAEYYRIAKDNIERARELLQRDMVEEARALIEEAKGYIEKIEIVEKKEGMALWLLLLISIPPFTLVVILLYWKFFMPKPRKMVDVSRKKRLSITMVRKLSERLNKIDIEKLGESERYHYNKVKEAIDKIKESIIKDDIQAVRRYINSAEMHLKVLEYRMEILRMSL